MPTVIRSYVRSLGLDAYVVGGAVRDQFLGPQHARRGLHRPGRRPGRPQGAARAARSRGGHGGARPARRRPAPSSRPGRPRARAGRHRRDSTARRAVDGPGHRDFVIVSDPSIGLEEDMARRDFTINAMAIRLDDGALVDPFGGVADLERRLLRTVAPRASRTTRCGWCARCASSRSSVSTCLPKPRRRCGRTRPASPTSPPSGSAAGSRPTGSGELSKLLLGSEPRARAPARAGHRRSHGGDPGVRAGDRLLPRLAPAAAAARRAHLRRRPEHRGCGRPLEVRLAALLHDLGKPVAAADRKSTMPARGRGSPAGSCSGSAIRRGCGNTWSGSSRLTAFKTEGPLDDRVARRFLARHGDELAFDLIRHKRADLAAKRPSPGEREWLEQLHEAVLRERAQPHRLADLAVDGDDLRAIGFSEGPELGRRLRRSSTTWSTSRRGTSPRGCSSAPPGSSP